VGTSGSKHPDLDLVQSIRPRLDILAHEIVIALEKRTRFPQNLEIYRPGLVPDEPDTPLLHHALGMIERTHAALGRYTYAAQEAFTDVGGVHPVIARAEPRNPIPLAPSGVGARIVDFYLDWIRERCAPGSDARRYGETVTADVNVLLGIMERVNLGKLVAESKLAADPQRFRATEGRRDEIVELIVRRDREAEVRASAERLARHYDFEPAAAVAVFEWMIATTIDVEVRFIRMRLAEAEGAGSDPNAEAKPAQS